MKQKISSFFMQYPRLELAQGVLLIREGNMPNFVYYITSGSIGLFDITDSGNRIVLNVFKEPAFVPMSLAMHQLPTKFFYETITECTVHKVPALDAVQYIKDNPDVMFDLLSRVYRGTNNLLQRLAYQMGGSARHQLVYELFNAARREGQPLTERPDSYNLQINEANLAARTGLSRETVNRELKRLKNERIVTVARGGLVVLSLSALGQLLG